MDGGDAHLAGRTVTGSDGCEGQLHVGAEILHFSDIDVDRAGAANLEACGGPISHAPGESRLEIEQLGAHQDSTSIEAASAAKATGQSPQATNLRPPTFDAAAAAPACSSDSLATAAMDVQGVANFAPCESSAASILPTAPQNVSTKRRTCQNCRIAKLKCDKEHPCSRCRKKNLPCVFKPLETRPKTRRARRRESRGTASRICGDITHLQIEGCGRRWPASPNVYSWQRPMITSVPRDSFGEPPFRGKASIPSHFGHPRSATAELKRNSENARGGTHTTALQVPEHESFQAICANKPHQAIPRHPRLQNELGRVTANSVLNFSSAGRTWPSQCSGQSSSSFQPQTPSHGSEEKEVIGTGTLSNASSLYMIETMATRWSSEKSPVTQNRGNLPAEDAKIDGLNSVFISVDNNPQSMRAAGIAGKKLLNDARELGNDSIHEMLAPELTLPISQAEPGLMPPASSSLSKPIDAIDFGDERMSTAPRRAYIDGQVNCRNQRDLTTVSQLGVRAVDVKGAEVSQVTGIGQNAQRCEVQSSDTRQSVVVFASVEDWTRTGLHRLLNCWLEVMQRVIYNQERAVRTLIHLAHTAIASRRPDLLQHVLFLLKQNGRKFDACSSLREVEYRKKSTPCQEAHSKDACLFPLRLNGVDMHACHVIYLTVSYGVIQMCDANDVFKKNVMDLIVNDENVFDILARIFSGDDLLLCYDAMVELYCGVSSEITLKLNYNKTVANASGLMKDEASQAQTQVRIRYEISEDGNYAKYGICMLPSGR